MPGQLTDRMVKGNESLHCIHQVHQDVEDETIEDEGVKKADRRAPAEGAALRQGGDECVPEPLRKMIEARIGVGAAAANAAVDAIEAAQSDRDGYAANSRKAILCANGSIFSSELLAQLGDHCRNDLMDVADDAVVRDFEDGRVGILIDGHDELALVHSGEMLHGS